MSIHLALLIGYSVALVALGLWISRLVRNSADFFVAGRSLGAPLLFSTVLAANIGAGTTIGAAGVGYRDGISAWWWNGAAAIGSIFLAFLVGPAIWRLANAYLTEAAPWSAIKDDPARAATIVNTGINLVRVSALVAWPFIPSSAEKVLCSLGESTDPVPWPQDALWAIPAGRRITVPPLLFPKISVADLLAAQAS